jgi:hypothetical protein
MLINVQGFQRDTAPDRTASPSDVPDEAASRRINANASGATTIGVIEREGRGRRDSVA